MSKEYELAIKIAGEIEKSFYASTKLTKKELEGIAKTAATSSAAANASMTQNYSQATKGINNMGNKAKKVFSVMSHGAILAGLAVTGLGAASVYAGIKFESAFAGVKKTTDATKAQYAELRQGILDMSKVLPSTANDIAAVAENAGQLGIKRQNLLAFTKVMIDMGESTNLSAEEASVSLAKFANITRMGAGDYTRLGSSIVDLGNNFATTEKDIVEMGTRLASSATLAGISEPQIMALAASMSSVGIQAEAGGSAMSKFIRQMQVSVETGKGNLKNFANVANMSSKEFQKAFKEDAVSAMSAFLKGLNDTKRNGKSATLILDDMDIKEVRLTNTILALSKAHGTMNSAVQTANKAWEQNTALTNEANKRYETTESKIKMLRNRMVAMGIKVYDEFSVPIRDAIDSVSGFVENLTDNTIPDLADSFSKNLPTAIQTMKEFGGAIGEFARPFLKVGTWMWNHKDVVSSALIGIGSAIVTYKVASGIVSVASAAGGLAAIFTNPLALGIVAVALAIGGAAGIAAYIKNANETIKKQNLAEHFGDITLSLQELGDVAKRIISTSSLDKIQKSLSEFDKVDGIAKVIQDTVGEIEKLNWKVSIGLKLSKDEKDAYKSGIETYIKKTQDIIQQDQYALNLNLKVMTDNDAAGKSIREGFNHFYTKNYNDVSALGTKLQETVNKAFEDGLLTIDEAKKITELQNQMSNITEKLAQSKFDAQIDVLDLKYSGGALDPETFKNLQNEINTQVKAATASYDESLTLDIASAKVRLDQGDIDKTEYDNMVKGFRVKYLENVGEIKLKASKFELGTIKQQYSKELGEAMPKLQNLLNENADGPGTRTGYDLTQYYDNIAKKAGGILDNGPKLGVSSLMQNYSLTQTELNKLAGKFEELGVKIPAELDNAIQDGINMTALSGTSESIKSAMGYSLDKISNDTSTFQTYWDMLNVSMNTSFKSKIPAFQNTANTAANSLKDRINLALGQPMTIQKQISVKINSNIFSDNSLENIIKSSNNAKLPGYANGDIIKKPTLATFAENGPEAAIPLNGSTRSIGLWQKAGQMLGVFASNQNGESINTLSDGVTQKKDSFGSLLGKVSGTNQGNTNGASAGQPLQITYSPVHHFNGGAPTKDDLVAAGRITQSEFDKMMSKWTNNNNRVGFQH